MLGLVFAIAVAVQTGGNPFLEQAGIYNNIIVGADANGTVWIIRREDYDARTADGMKGWITLDHSRDKTTKARRTMLQVYVKCAPRQLWVYQMLDYDSTGNVLASSADPYPNLRATDIVPGSIADEVADKVCPPA